MAMTLRLNPALRTRLGVLADAAGTSRTEYLADLIASQYDAARTDPGHPLHEQVTAILNQLGQADQPSPDAEPGDRTKWA